MPGSEQRTERRMSRVKVQEVGGAMGSNDGQRASSAFRNKKIKSVLMAFYETNVGVFTSVYIK